MLLRGLLFTVIFATSLNVAAVNVASVNEVPEGESVVNEATTEAATSVADDGVAADSKTVENIATASNTEQQKNADLRSQKMQQCLSLVDKNVLQRFKDKGLKLNRDIEKLCHDKQRNQAQSQAVGFAVEIQRSKDMSVFRHCGKIIDQSSSTMGQIMKTYSASDLRYIHICDRHIP